MMRKESDFDRRLRDHGLDEAWEAFDEACRDMQDAMKMQIKGLLGYAPGRGSGPHGAEPGSFSNAGGDEEGMGAGHDES